MKELEWKSKDAYEIEAKSNRFLEKYNIEYCTISCLNTLSIIGGSNNKKYIGQFEKLVNAQQVAGMIDNG